MLKERIFRSFISNVLIALVILSIFGITYFTVESPVKTNPDGIINRGESNTKVSLLFSVYDDTQNLETILKILDNQKVSATFFVFGSWIVKDTNDETLQRILNSGHELANSGYFKKDFSSINKNETKESIIATHKLVEAIAGNSMKYFMPPTGTYNNETVNIAKDLGYQTVLWTHDSMDLQNTNANIVFENATKQTVGGDFVLMHPTKVIAETLDKIIQNITLKGLKLSTLSENIAGD